jgi:polysaccharide pyruvyl transferase WcaK-like protein
VLGGGGLLQDETSTINLDLHLMPVAVARLRRAPVAGVGLGAGPLTTRSGRLRVRRLLVGVPLTVRDDASADLLAAIGLLRPTVAADLALSLPAPTAAPSDRIVVCLRPWSGRRHHLPARLRRHGPDDRFATDAAASLDALSAATGLPVHLVAFDAPKDSPLQEAVAARMRSLPTMASPNRRQVLDEVAASRLVVAMRYHGGMAAVLAGRPTVLIGYSPKVDALALELGPGAAARRWSPDGLGDLTAAATAVLGRGDDVLAARDRLVLREQANGDLLDRLLERTETLR